MDAFQALLRLVLDESSFNQIQSRINSRKLNLHVGVNGADQLNLDKRISMLANQMLTFRNNNTKMNKAMTGELNQMYNKLINGANLSQKEVTELSAQFARLKLQVRDAGMLGHSMGNKFKNAWAKFSQWGLATGLLMRGINGIRNMIVGVKDLDTALVDLRKTTTMSASQLEDFYYTANETAKQMGVTTKEIISQAAAWSRLGYSSAEAATKMAKYSSMFASISPGMDVDKATDGLVSIMKAFDIGNDNPDEVLDGIMSKINIIGNTAATSNQEIVEMLTRSSSAMREANNTLEETIALETAAVEINRDPESVGTAFKTISMRIRGYDEETESYSNNVEELSGKIADLTKTAATPGGISIFSDSAKTQYKSTYQIIKEISEIYDQLTDKNQAELLEVIAAKRQGQIVAAAINNFEAAEKAMDDMANSAGSAEREMAIIMDSVDYKANKLKETGTGIAQNLFARDDMKAFLDVVTKLAEGIDFLTDKLGLLGTISLGTGLFMGLKNVGINMLVAYLSNHYCFELPTI